MRTRLSIPSSFLHFHTYYTQPPRPFLSTPRIPPSPSSHPPKPRSHSTSSTPQPPTQTSVDNSPQTVVDNPVAPQKRDPGNPIAHKFNSHGGRPFIDYLNLILKGGPGGDGCVSFFRDTAIPDGPPNGGNGGAGGNVYAVADKNVSDLRNWSNIVGGRGQNGAGSAKNGTAGSDVRLHVPIGTVVRELEATAVEKEATLNSFQQEFRLYPGWVDRGDDFSPPKNPFDEQKKQFYADLKKPLLNVELLTHGESHLLVRGGAGGLGNPNFVTKVIRQPKFSTCGSAGQSKRFVIELKTIADAGLVGLPNAGKSTFLTAISNALPKIAAYPFTTLNPYIGTIDYPDRHQVKIADIPGLVAGAHKNIGLGHSFLRHVERSKVLVYVVDLSGPAPWNDIKTLREELELFRPGLTNRPSLIVANKADRTRLAQPNLARLQEEFKESGGTSSPLHIIPVSAKHKKNVIKVTDTIRQLVYDASEKEREEQAAKEIAEKKKEEAIKKWSVEIPPPYSRRS